MYDVANLTQTITVNVNGDTKFEIDEDFSVEIDSVTNATIHPTDNQSTAIIVNDDPLPQVSLSLTNSPFAENGGIAILTATLSNLSSQDLTVNLDYAGTASHGVDYNAPTTIIIPADNLTGIINLTGIDDNITEGDETVIVNIANVINGTENGIQEVTAIITDDNPPPTVTLSLSDSPFAETGGMATITATLSNPSSEDVTISLGFSGTAENGIDYSASDNTILIPAGNDFIRGGKDDDLTFGDQGNDTLLEDQGNDLLIGGTNDPNLPDTNGRDLILGGAGDDFINGNENNDTLSGGEGDDLIRAGTGNDLVLGDQGNDTLFGDLGQNSLDGGAGDDILVGGNGSQVFSQEPDHDFLCGGAGDDLVLADTGNDTVYGGSGNDTLFGGKGNDLIFGDSGDDWLFGGEGEDTLTGGSGQNHFVLTSNNHFVFLSQIFRLQIIQWSKSLCVNQ